jgi:hypothetical protein
MTAAISLQQGMGSPGWLVAATLFAARPLIRAGLWLTMIDLQCTASGQQYSVKRAIVAAGLSCLNLCATAAGAVLGWLAKAVLLAQRMGRCPERRWKRKPGKAVAEAADVFALQLRD